MGDGELDKVTPTMREKKVTLIGFLQESVTFHSVVCF